MARPKNTTTRPPRETIRLHLTAAGWVYLAVVMLLGLAAARNGAALMLGVFGCLTGAILFSVWAAWRTLRRVEVHRETPLRDWQYKTIHLGYYLHNRGRLPCLGVEVEEIAVEGVDRAAGYCVSIPAGGAFRAGGRLAARRRGLVDLPGVILRTRFPFGLVLAQRHVRLPASILIWPARGQLRRSLLRGGAAETSSAAPSRATGGQDEFFGLRDYRSDDNPRWIHWKRSATRGSLVVREMTRARPDVLWIVLDTRADNEPSRDRLERVLRFAATLADHAFARGYRVGLAAAGPEGPRVIDPGSGRGRRTELLDALATARPSETHTLAGTLAALRGRGLEQCQVVVVPAGASPRGLARMPAWALTVLEGEALEAAFADAAPYCGAGVSPASVGLDAGQTPAPQPEAPCP